MTASELRDAIVAAIAVAVPSLRWCEATGGRFDLDEVNRRAVNSPGVAVACLGATSATVDGGTKSCSWEWAAYLFARGTSAEARDAMALNMVEVVSGVIVGNRWGSTTAHAPRNVRASNIYSGTVDRHGVALWAITWSQAMDIEASTDGLDELVRMLVDYDLAPRDGVPEAQDGIELQGERMSSYGSISVTTSAPTAIATIDTWQKLAGTTTIASDVEDYDSPSAGRLRYTGTADKTTEVQASASLAVSAPATVTIGLAVNGVVDETTAIQQTIAAAAVEAVSTTLVVELSTNDYVELWAKASATVNVTMGHGIVVASAT